MSRHHLDDTAMAVKKAVTQKSSAANRRMIPMMHLNCWTTSCVEGELLMGDTLVRRGRPPFLWQTETAITLRLDADVVGGYGETGEGWRARITAGLRRVHKLNVRSTTSRSF